jgi:hypothetical protein
MLWDRGRVSYNPDNLVSITDTTTWFTKFQRLGTSFFVLATLAIIPPATYRWHILVLPIGRPDIMFLENLVLSDGSSLPIGVRLLFHHN